MSEIIDAKTFLGKSVFIEIDRPMGSKHPEYGFVYEINYGFVPGVKALDGDELDAYVLGVAKPLKGFSGKCIAVIHRIDDNDDKLVLVPKGRIFSDNEIRKLTNFQEKFFKSVIIR